MFHVCIAHCMPEKIHKMSKCENSCLFVWSTVQLLQTVTVYFPTSGNSFRSHTVIAARTVPFESVLFI